MRIEERDRRDLVISIRVTRAEYRALTVLKEKGKHSYGSLVGAMALALSKSEKVTKSELDAVVVPESTKKGKADE